MAASNSEVVVSVDRTKVCPCLLRCFYKVNGAYLDQDYSQNQVPKQETIIYTWRDATLKEIVDLLKEGIPTVREKGLTFIFSLVYPDRSGKYVLRKVYLIFVVVCFISC